jgi:hypothetical protein
VICQQCPKLASTEADRSPCCEPTATHPLWLAFVGRVAEFCLEESHAPNRCMAFKQRAVARSHDATVARAVCLLVAQTRPLLPIRRSFCGDVERASWSVVFATADSPRRNLFRSMLQAIQAWIVQTS